MIRSIAFAVAASCLKHSIQGDFNYVTREEVAQVMDDLRAADVDFLTVGQYLQPTPKHAALDRYVTPEEFESYATLARAKGFLMVSSSPLTRSSYHADEDFVKLREARDRQSV